MSVEYIVSPASAVPWSSPAYMFTADTEPHPPSHPNYLELRRMQATPPLDPLQIMRAATLTALFSGRDTPLGKGVLEGLSALAAR